MNRILVTYSTFSGTTIEVAEFIGETLANKAYEVTVLPMSDVDSPADYDAIVAGAPMILGWHREARRFLNTHQKTFEETPLAVFVTAMSLTKTNMVDVAGVPVFIDEKLPKEPVVEGRLSLRERYATAANYARPILRAVRPVKPVSIAFFGGRLDYGRLKWWAVVFAMLLVRAQAGDRRNWDAIGSWAASLPETMGLRD